MPTLRQQLNNLEDLITPILLPAQQDDIADRFTKLRRELDFIQSNFYSVSSQLHESLRTIIEQKIG